MPKRQHPPQVIASLTMEELFALIGRQAVQLESNAREIRKRDEIISSQQQLLGAKATAVKK